MFSIFYYIIFNSQKEIDIFIGKLEKMQVSKKYYRIFQH